MSKSFRNKLSGYLVLQQIKRSNRSSEVVSFKNASRIGILYDATSDHDYELMKNYVRDLMTYSKDVMALGYYDAKQLPPTRFMKLGLDFFTRKSLSWKLKPYDPIVNNFIERKNDILILFNVERSIPLAYIANQANARFRIGKYDPAFEGLFDFMIKVEKHITLEQMIKQVNHYLNLIQNEKLQEA